MRKVRTFLFGSRKRTVLSGLAVAVLVPAVAWAAWTLTASNTLWKGRTGTLQAVTFSAVATPTTTQLYPGTSSPVEISTNNPNSVPVQIIAANGTPSISFSTGGAGCTGAMFTFDITKLVGVAVPVGSGLVQSAAGALTMAPTAHNDCQGRIVFVDGINLTYGLGS